MVSQRNVGGERAAGGTAVGAKRRRGGGTRMAADEAAQNAGGLVRRRRDVKAKAEMVEQAQEAGGRAEAAAGGGGCELLTAGAAETMAGRMAMGNAGARWVEVRRERGWSEGELVVELHVRQGRALEEVAEILGMSPREAGEVWRGARLELAAQAPQAEGDFAVLRERLAAGLWMVVEQTHGRAPGADALGLGAVVMTDGELRGSVERVDGPEATEPPEGSNVGGKTKRTGGAKARGWRTAGTGAVVRAAGAAAAPAGLAPCPRLLALRLRALDQIAKLYGVNLGREAGADEAVPYAAPGEIAEDVRRKVLALHGRGEDGLEGEFEE